VYDHGTQGIEIVFDLWKNLGRCRMLDDIGWAYYDHSSGLMIEVPRDSDYHTRRRTEAQSAGSDVGYFRDAVPDMARSETAMGHPSTSLIRERLAACEAVSTRPNGVKRILKRMVFRRCSRKMLEFYKGDYMLRRICKETRLEGMYNVETHISIRGGGIGRKWRHAEYQTGLLRACVVKGRVSGGLALLSLTGRRVDWLGHASKNRRGH